MPTNPTNISMTGQPIASYHILAEIASGGQATVYRARHTVLQREVALKVLHPHLLTAPDFVDKFAREAQLLAQLKHPNIVEVYDANRDAATGLYFIAMEFLPGTYLETLIARQGKLAVDVVVSVARQVASTLEYAHARNLIHRDIKPGNIMLLPDGTVKVLDFGIAAIVAAGQKAKTRIGTQEYMAPEHFAGGADARSDIYSLGATLYHCLTGQLPPIIAVQPPTPPRQLNPAISLALENMILEALQADAAKRQQTAREFIIEIESALHAPQVSISQPATMVCLHCGAANRVGAKHCARCGREMAVVPPALVGELSLQVVKIRDSVNANSPQQQFYALIEATAAGEQIVGVQMPLNLCLVLGCSGSINNPKIQNLQQAVRKVIEQLQPTDFISIVLFGDQVETRVHSQPATNKAQLMSVVDTFEYRGSAQMSLGLRKGLDEILQNCDLNRINRIVLLTDGDTRGDEATCQSVAQQAAQYNIPIITLGLGLDWNEALIESIAQASGGISDLVDAPDKIVSVFNDTLHCAQATVIRNAELSLRLALGVTACNIWQVQPVIKCLSSRSISAREVGVTLGEIETGGKSALVKLSLPPQRPGTNRVAQIEISYDVPAARLVGEKARVDLIVECGVESAINPRIANIIEKVLLLTPTTSTS